MAYEEILDRALSRVPLDVDKREGGIIYDALAPACFELAQMYIELEEIENRTYADTSTGEDLSRRCEERWVYRNSASRSIRKGVFNIDVPIGSRFSIEDTNYIVKEKIIENEFKLECEQEGVIGNIYSGTLLPIEYIEGLTTATLTDILIPGEDEEDDESLRKRYFEALSSAAFGGNVADYKKKTNELPGVGGNKVYPVWNGGGTVKIVIIDSDFNKPSLTLVDDVQTAIDPIQNQGKGIGIAPIGHIVDVFGVSETIINLSSNITLQSGYVWEDVKPRIVTVLNEYYKELRSEWETEETIVVRISYIETRILGVIGVLDIQNTTINTLAQNLVLDLDNIPVYGNVIQI